MLFRSVSLGYEPRTRLVRQSGQPALMFGILRKTGSNTLEVMEGVRAVLAEVNATYVERGIEHFEAKDPLAWPMFAGESDVDGLPMTVISVNECDPLRDEGIEFYRFLNEAGVPARCRQVMGTVHGSEVFAVSCPDVARETASSIALLARQG